jgi:hypothetical protein
MVLRNASSGPNITAGRTRNASANSARTARSPSAALSDVAGWRGGIGADPRNVNKPFDSGPVGLGCYPLSRLHVNRLKSLRSALTVKADSIYYAVGADQRIRD